MFKHVSDAQLTKLHPAYGFSVTSPDFVDAIYGIGKPGSYVKDKYPSRKTHGNSCAADVYFGWAGPTEKVKERLQELYKLSTGVTTAILSLHQNKTYSALLREEGWTMVTEFENHAHGKSRCFLWMKVHHPVP